MLEQNVGLNDCLAENSCADVFTSLIDVLRMEVKIYQELKNIIVGEKMILTKPSLAELNQSNALKENIVLKARMLEETRTNILKKIARNLDLGPKDISLKKLCSYAGREQRREVEDLTGNLAALARDIGYLNKSNKYMLDAALKSVSGSLDFIGSMMSRGEGYSESGKIRTVPNNGKFLHTEG